MVSEYHLHSYLELADGQTDREIKTEESDKWSWCGTGLEV
jgi:hypothetical protein